jgi:hypothetical protein
MNTVFPTARSSVPAYSTRCNEMSLPKDYSRLCILCSLMFEQMSMTEASQFLHQALDGRAYWRSVTVLLPDSWPANCVPRPVVGSSGELPDISVGVPHPVFGNTPWTQQSQGCGQRGDMIYLSYRRLQNIGTYFRICHVSTDVQENRFWWFGLN